MNRLGIIDQSRLKNIPPKSQPQHEFCFHLHDLMTSLLVQMEIQKAGQVTLESLTDKDRRLLESGLHILDFLNESGRGDLERRAVINHLCVALYADMLHFIYEGLRALEKRKFADEVRCEEPFKPAAVKQSGGQVTSRLSLEGL